MVTCQTRYHWSVTKATVANGPLITFQKVKRYHWIFFFNFQAPLVTFHFETLPLEFLFFLIFGSVGNVSNLKRYHWIFFFFLIFGSVSNVSNLKRYHWNFFFLIFGSISNVSNYHWNVNIGIFYFLFWGSIGNVSLFETLPLEFFIFNFEAPLVTFQNLKRYPIGNVSNFETLLKIK
jgi:hypothetical protein